MASEDFLGVQIVQIVLGIVFDHPDFLENDAFFLGQFFGVEQGMVKNIREKIDPLLQGLIQHFGVERGAFARGKSVQLSAHRVNFARDGLGRTSPRAFEDHVFDKVREPLFARLFVARSDIHPHTDRD